MLSRYIAWRLARRLPELLRGTPVRTVLYDRRVRTRLANLYRRVRRSPLLP